MYYKKMLCGALAASMLTVPALAADFSDTAGHWAASSIDRWSDYGVIDGYTDGSFGPGDSITRAQMAVILDRLFGWTQQAENYFSDISGSEWYAGAVLRANAAGVMNGDTSGAARPNDSITRQDAAVMLTRALRLESSGSGTTFVDAEEIGSWAKDAVQIMSSMGLINGTGNGVFSPRRSITRAEAVSILDRAIGGYYDRAGVYTADADGPVMVIAAPGVTLRGVTVDGDLIIAPGAEGSETILNDVTVTGTVRVLSGKDASVLLRGETCVESVEMDGENSRLQAAPSVEIGSLTVSGSGTHVRGLDEDQQVTVADGAQGVLVNGHPTQSGSTVTAGEDVSTDADNVEVEPDDKPSGGGSAGSGGSSEPSKPSNPSEPETPDEPSEPSEPETPDDSNEPERPDEPDEPSEPESPDEPDEPETQPGGSGNRDEDGNIIVDFDDLFNGM